MSNSTKTYTVNGNTFILEEFIPNSYRVRVIVGNETSPVIALLGRHANPNYAPWRANLQGDLNARCKYQFVFKKTSFSLQNAIDIQNDCSTIEESLSAIKPEWVAGIATTMI